MSSAASGDLPAGAPDEAPDQGPGAAPDAGGRERAERPGLSPRGLLLAVSAFTAVLLTALLGVLHVPYVALSPGPVVDVIAGSHAGQEQEGDAGEGSVEGLISISGAQTHPTGGALDLTTVSVRGGPGLEMTLGELLLSWRDPDVSVAPRALYYPGGQTQQEADERSAAEMTGSQENAKVAALRELGIDVPATTTTRVEQVAADAPAARVLRPGDTITSVDGDPVADFAALQAAVRALPADAPVTLGLTRGGVPQTVSTRTVSSGGVTLLGITPDVEHDFPFSIDIAIDDVGGPSAGTMFALGIVDELTPGAMTGGEHVAGTGAIAADGTVLEIGGLRQKVLGARAEGARWFLAPRAECGQVAGAVPEGITVLPVSTLHEARAAVEAIGAGEGGTLQTCEAVAAAG